VDVRHVLPEKINNKDICARAKIRRWFNLVVEPAARNQGLIASGGASRNSVDGSAREDARPTKLIRCLKSAHSADTTIIKIGRYQRISRIAFAIRGR
jgi:hypothetical protein